MSINKVKKDKLLSLLNEKIADIENRVEKIHADAKNTEIDLDKKFMNTFKGVKKTSESVVEGAINLIEGATIDIEKIEEIDAKLDLVIKALEIARKQQEETMSEEAKKIKAAEEALNKEMLTLESQIDLLLGLETTSESELKVKKAPAKKAAAKKPAAKKAAAKPAAKKPNPKVLESVKQSATQIVFAVDQKTAAFAKKLEGKVLKAKDGKENPKVIETAIKKVEIKDGKTLVTIQNNKFKGPLTGLSVVLANGEKGPAIKITGTVAAAVAPAKPAAKPAPKARPEAKAKPAPEKKPAIKPIEKPKKESSKKENIDDIMNEINTVETKIDLLLKKL